MEMNKYQNGKIYTIRHPDTNKYYIGSTCEKYLSNRFSKHKSGYKINTLSSTSKVLFDMGIDDCYIELLENYPCNDKNELHKREGELIRLHKDNIINKRIEGRTLEEWREENIENKREYDKQYRINNIENKRESNKQYRIDNKEKIKERRSQIYNCECNGKYTLSGKSQHIKTSKHKEYINGNK